MARESRSIRRGLSNALSGLGGFFGFGNRQPAMGPLFVEYGVDRTLGGCAHALDPLDGTGWQRNLDRIGAEGLPVLSAIFLLYGNAFAQLRPQHKRANLETGQVDDVTTSAASRLLVQPNSYESGATLLYRIAQDWLCGEALVFAPLNMRQEPAALHLIPRGHWTPRIDPETREVFFLVTDSPDMLVDPITDAIVAEGAAMVLPANQCMHLRWCTPRHPLVGESPFVAAGLAAGVNVALSRSQLAFTNNMRRVSQVLSTEQAMTSDQLRQLRTQFDEQAAKWAAGGVPILTHGLKLSGHNFAAIESSVIESLRWSNEEIARCAGVPPPMYGDLSAGNIASSEVLMAHWLSVSLGGLIERLEREFERLFLMDGRHDFLNMNTDALMRTDLVSVAEALTKFTQGGVTTPNEARRRIDLSPLPGGDELMMQRQMVPVDLGRQLSEAELAKAEAPPPAPPAPEPAPSPEPAPAPADDPEEQAQRMRAVLAPMLTEAVERVMAAAAPPAPNEPGEEADEEADAVSFAALIDLQRTRATA